MALGAQTYVEKYQGKVVVEKNTAANKFVMNTFLAGGKRFRTIELFLSRCCIWILDQW